MTVGGESPFRAVYGRNPNLLPDFEELTVSQLDDDFANSSSLDVSRSANRVREIALETKGPTILALTRQGLPTNKRETYNENLLLKGAYIIKNQSEHDASIFASGSEVEIAVSASEKLKELNINLRVISFPSMELFEMQNSKYKNEIIDNKPKFAVEAGVINGWEKYIDSDNFIGMKSFGASGPYNDVYKHFNITADNICKKIQEKLII